MSDESFEPPALVYIPCAEQVAKPEDACPLMQRSEDGRLVLLVYSTKEKLYAGWGDDRPWLALPGEALGALRESQGIDYVVVDAEGRVDADGRYSEAENSES